MNPKIESSARIVCERAAFEFSRERPIRVDDIDGSSHLAVTAEAYLANFAGNGMNQFDVSSAAVLVVASARAEALGCSGAEMMAINISGLSRGTIARMAGIGIDGRQRLEAGLAGRAKSATGLQVALLSLARTAGRLPAVVMETQTRDYDTDEVPYRLLSNELLLGTSEAARLPLQLSYLLSINLPLRVSDRNRLHLWRDASGREYHALEIGERSSKQPIVRLHSECFTGDVLSSLRCDCEPQLIASIERIAQEGYGVLIYLPQEGRGIGLTNKLRTYSLQENGVDTYEANRTLGFGDDERTFEVASLILDTLGIDEVDLLSNNPDKSRELQVAGIRVRNVLPHSFGSNPHNHAYINSKRLRENTLRGCTMQAASAA